MRARRLSACQALSQSINSCNSSEDKLAPLRLCSEASSHSSVGTNGGGFLESLFEDSSSSVCLSPEQEQAMYWRQLSYQKRRHQHDPDAWEQGISMSPPLSPAAPSSVVVDVKDIFLAKLQDSLSAQPLSQPLPESQAPTQLYLRQNSRLSSSVDFGPYEEQARQLEYTSDDVHQFLCVDREFSRLKKSLRREGAITNEFLKQVLPLVVKQSQERHQSRQQQTRPLEESARST